MEIDCWDGDKDPIVTHGHTFCTKETFDAVARAVGECAFVTSELPVILSLEMHCSPEQQHRIAQMLVKHVGDALLSVRTARSPPARAIPALQVSADLSPHACALTVRRVGCDGSCRFTLAA